VGAVIGSSQEQRNTAQAKTTAGAKPHQNSSAKENIRIGPEPRDANPQWPIDNLLYCFFMHSAHHHHHRHVWRSAAI
jgi:hypothetical protein